MTSISWQISSAVLARRVGEAELEQILLEFRLAQRADVEVTGGYRTEGIEFLRGAEDEDRALQAALVHRLAPRANSRSAASNSAR